MERTKAVRGIASNSVLPTFTAVTRDSVVPEHPRAAPAERGDAAQALPDPSLFQQPPPLSGCRGRDRNRAEGGLDMIHRISEASL